jgi:hypothetical protein
MRCFRAMSQPQKQRFGAGHEAGALAREFKSVLLARRSRSVLMARPSRLPPTGWDAVLLRKNPVAKDRGRSKISENALAGLSAWRTESRTKRSFAKLPASRMPRAQSSQRQKPPNQTANPKVSSSAQFESAALGYSVGAGRAMPTAG